MTSGRPLPDFLLPPPGVCANPLLHSFVSPNSPAFSSSHPASFQFPPIRKKGFLDVGSRRTRFCKNYDSCTSHHLIETPALQMQLLSPHLVTFALIYLRILHFPMRPNHLETPPCCCRCVLFFFFRRDCRCRSALQACVASEWGSIVPEAPWQVVTPTHQRPLLRDSAIR